MSRIAKVPINISADIVVQINDKMISIQGKKGKLTHTLNKAVDVKYINNQLIFTTCQGYANGWALAGTTRALLNSMVIGVTDGFTKKISLVGIGYRATVTGNVITLSLGFSHSIDHKLPEGITAECASQTEILLTGSDKQIIGQVAAELCSYRRPDPYKGKGIRYADAILYTKEIKKK